MRNELLTILIVEIEKAISEFEKNVKMETAISNVSGTALWVVDESREYYDSYSYISSL
jgi:hypothetical protein